MKPIPYFITIALAAACLILSLVLIISGQSVQKLSTDAQNQQIEINRGSLSQQVGANLLKDMAASSVSNEKMKAILTKHGFTVNVNPNGNPTPAPKPASASK
jgi:cell division protein YceG involved in septum cleavage